MENKVIFKEFEINTTPLEKMVLDPYSIEIELDDIEELRYKVIVKPYQAIKVVTIDCVSSKDYYNEYCFRDGFYHRHILEIDNSLWIQKLKKNITSSNMFLDGVKHFVLPLQDIIVEVIAKDIEIIKV